MMSDAKMTRWAEVIPAGKVSSYHPITRLEVRDATCRMDLSYLGKGSCGKPATVQVAYFIDSRPYWAEWWCPEHAAVFTEEDQA